MPTYRAHSVQAISFYRPDTGEVAQFDLIDGQAFELTRKPIMQTVQAGKKITVKDLVTLKVTVFDSGMLDMLKTWQAYYVPIQAVAAGEPNLQWYDSCHLRITKETKSAEGLWKFTLEMEAVEVFGQQNIFMNENLLAYLGWKDTNGDNKADYYTILNGTATLFQTNIQRLNLTPMGSAAEFFSRIEFPISGLLLHFSVNYAIQFVPLNGALSTRMEFMNYAQQILANPSVSYTIPNIRSVSGKTPANTFFLNVILARIVSGDPSIGGGYSNPALTTNGKITPGTTFMSW